MSVTINRKITVKSIVTPELKDELGKQIDDAKMQINTNISALNERLVRAGSNKGIASQIENEISRLNTQLAEVEKKSEEISKLQFGGEFYQGNLESPIEINLGDNLFEKITRGEIVVNNGEVIEFRNI
ncbi:MAG: YlqD family protein [Candidatus Muiribacteriota bacterium]|jgi:hypothetical protein